MSSSRSDEPRRLWNLSGTQAVFILIVCVAFLGFALYDEVVRAPIAAGHLRALDGEWVGFSPPTGASMHASLAARQRAILNWTVTVSSTDTGTLLSFVGA